VLERAAVCGAARPLGAGPRDVYARLFDGDVRRSDEAPRPSPQTVIHGQHRGTLRTVRPQLAREVGAAALAEDRSGVVLARAPLAW
jgi:hypothetical protein